MGRLHHLRQSLPRIACQPALHCIVVDYACPDKAGNWVEENFPRVSVVHASGVQYFNVGKARNLGAAFAHTPWLCFMDADTLVGPDFARDVVQLLRGNVFLLAEPCPNELAGMVVCSRDDFTGIGGYDELFSGWGVEDRDLYTRLALKGLEQAFFPADAIRVITHGDAERGRHHEITDHFVSLRINGMYFQIKTDLARLTEVVELPLSDRQAIRERVHRLVLSNPREAVKMDITLPWQTEFTQPPDWRLRRTISYCFEPMTAPHHE